MAINRKYARRSYAVKEGGEVLATLYPLDTAGLKELMVTLGQDISALLTVVEETEFGAKSPDDVAQSIKDNAPRIVGVLANALPNLLPTVVCASAGEVDEEALEVVRLWPVPVQVEAAAHVMELTVPDDTSFRDFVGNVMALLQVGKSLTGGSAMQVNRRSPQQPAAARSLPDG